MEAIRATLKGISWTRDSEAVCMKYFARKLAQQQFLQAGSLAGWTTVQNERNLAELIEHLVVGGREFFEEHSAHVSRMFHKGPVFGQALTGRGRNFKKLEAFQAIEHFKPLVTLLDTKFDKQEPLYPHERLEVHERVILLQTIASPGVYVRVSMDHPNRGYIGEGGKVGVRAYRPDDDFYVRRVYTTLDKPTAVCLQNSIFMMLEAKKLVACYRISNRSLAYQSRGWLQLGSGMSLVEETDKIVNRYYKQFCRATVGLENL